MSSAEEEEWSGLMAQAQNGDGEAYASLLVGVLPRLRQFVRYRITDSYIAEDVVQDVLLSIHSSRHTYDPDRAFAPWLFAIAARRVADHLRKIYRLGGREMLVDEYPETFNGDGTNDYIEGALAYATSDTLKKALAQLSEGQRTAVELLKLKDLSLKEAAEQSTMTVPALKVAMHRAMKTLQKIIDT